jgi:hypothetical protein
MPPRPSPRALLSTAALVGLVVTPGLSSCVVGPAVAGAHSAPPSGASEAQIRREENRTLGPQHAAEHAAQRRALRRWQGLSPAARNRARRAARRAAVRSGPGGPADQLGRWSTTTYPMPQWALNAVVLPTGKVAYWGRGALGTGYGGGRDNAGMFYVWDPATGESVEHPPPDVFFDRDADGVEDDTGPAPLFCSGQSLLPSGELYVAGGNRFAPWVRASGGGNPEYAGWWGTYSFDPWAERWTVQPRMAHGRWYPTQVELPDGRIAITSGYDEDGAGTDNDTMEIFTPHPERGGVGTLATVPAGFHDTAGFYPHMQVVPGGNVLLAGPGQHDSALLDPARLGQAASGSAWTQHGSSSRYRIGSSAALLPPAAPGLGSTRLMLLGGHRGEDLDPATGLEQSTAVVETTDVAEDAPGWRSGRPGEPPNLDQPRSYGNLVQLPTGGFAYLGGAAGFRRASSGPEGSNATMGKQELKSVALWNPGQATWRRGPASRKWRSYHSTAVLLPDGRVLSAGDDYWGMDDLPHTGFETPQDHAEIYEPAYLFDGDERAPRPQVTGGPAAVRWGDDFGIRIAEVAGRPITRVTLVGPPAVTHAVDMNRKFAELKIVERVPGVGVNVEAPTGADLAPPGWYMLFAVDAAGTPAVAHWVQIRGDAADAPRVGPGGGGGGGGGTPTTPGGPSNPPAGGGAPAPGPRVRDVRGPRVGVVVRRPKRASRVLSVRVGADEPARLRLRFEVQGRKTQRTLRLTPRRLSRTITLRLSRTERARLRQGRSLRLRIRTAARDAAGNDAGRSLRMTVRAGRTARAG